MRYFRGVEDGLTGIDKHGGGGVQVGPLMEGGEAGNTHTIAVTNRDDVEVPFLHSSR